MNKEKSLNIMKISTDKLKACVIPGNKTSGKSLVCLLSEIQEYIICIKLEEKQKNYLKSGKIYLEIKNINIKF